MPTVGALSSSDTDWNGTGAAGRCWLRTHRRSPSSKISLIGCLAVLIGAQSGACLWRSSALGSSTLTWRSLLGSRVAVGMSTVFYTSPARPALTSRRWDFRDAKRGQLCSCWFCGSKGCVFKDQASSSSRTCSVSRCSYFLRCSGTFMPSARQF